MAEQVKSGAKPLSPYEVLSTPCFASRADQRFGYYLYVPGHFTLDNATRYRLVVLIHGTDRSAQTDCSGFADFAEAQDCIVLAPLFPAGIHEPGEVNNYKFLAYREIRFDLLLLAMVAEVAERYGLSAERFLLHGFSGGGHFAHRFFYLHPERLQAVSIGAPGMVTLLDFDRDWHVGVRDVRARFDKGLDIAAMRAVPVQMVIGGDDADTWEITIAPESHLWMPEVNDAGATRLERMVSLRDSFLRHDIAVRHDIVPGVAHRGAMLVPAVQAFFADVLKPATGVGQ